MRCSPNVWRELRKQGLAPEPKFRSGDGDVYLGVDIKRFLGILDDDNQEQQHDPFKKGLQKLGRDKK